MNKSIKYLGFSFLGAMLFLSLGALRPFISSESGLGNNTILSNATMVSSFRSLYGSLTNICADDTGLQHVRIIPQTANTGEFDIGDPAQTTGRYLMFSKANASFLIGHDGTDAFRVNSANGTTYIAGPQTNNNNIDMNGHIQTWDGAGNMVLFFGNDPVNSPSILSRGLALSLQSQFGDIQLLPAANVSMLSGNFNTVGSINGNGITSTGTVTTLGTGGGADFMQASNGIGAAAFRPDFNMQLVITNIWPTNAAAPGQVLQAIGTNALGVHWGWVTPAASSLTSPSGFSLTSRTGARVIVNEDFTMFNTTPYVQPGNANGVAAMIVTPLYSNHIGLLAQNIATNASAYSDCPGQVSMVILGNADWYSEFTFVITNLDLNMPITNAAFRIGFNDSRSDVVPANGMYALLTTNLWEFVTTSNNVRTTNYTSTVGMTNIWQTVGVYSPAPNTNAFLYVNGVCIATNTTTIPLGISRPSTPRIGAGSGAGPFGDANGDRFGWYLDYIWVAYSPVIWP